MQLQKEIEVLDIKIGKTFKFEDRAKSQAVSGFIEGLSEKGLNCLTKSKVEHIICTSALCAFN